MDSISRIDYSKPEDLPNIVVIYGSGDDLYGITACFHQKRYPDDKILTKIQESDISVDYAVLQYQLWCFA